MDKNKILELTNEYLQKENTNFDKKDIEVLQKILQFHNELYYEKDEPIITDSEYDMLFKKLQYIEGLFQVDESQTERV